MKETDFWIEGPEDGSTRPSDGEEAYETLLAPRLYGRDVYLRAVQPRDYEFIQRIELGGHLATRWRFRGATPDPQEWTRQFWKEVLAQYLVVGRKRDQPIGLVYAYRPNFADGHTHLAAVRFEQHATPLMLYGLALFIDHVFTCWNFRKLYYEVTEYNYTQFASGVGRFFEIEGRRREYRYFGGRYWDELILATTRESWMEHGKPLADAQYAPGARRVHVRMPPPTQSRP
jgi:RimJ/RimL family protein N-acetyltransferase